MCSDINQYNVIVYGSHQHHAALNGISIGLVNALQEMGYSVFFCDCFDGCNNNFVQAINLLNSGKISFSIGLNDLGIEWECDEEKIYPYSVLNVPHVSITLDMPYNGYVKGFDTPCNNHIVTVIDKSALDYVRSFYPDKANHVLHLPLAGVTGKNDSDMFSLDKKYDVVYISGLWSYGGKRSGIKRPWYTGEVSSNVIHILDDAADYLECNTDSVFNAMKKILTLRGLCGDEYLRKMLPHFWKLLFYTKTWRRIKGMEFLVKNDIKVDVFGDGWEQVPFANRLTLHNAVSYEETLHIYAQSKILFQDAGEFNYGANDRTFNAMLNGAVLVTEYSRYLDESFTAGHDLFMYDWQNGENQVRVIHELLHDDCRRLSVALSAYGKADKNHRWKNRVQQILSALNLLYGVEMK